MSGRAFERGTAVAIEGRGLLILGPSGAGKTALALDLIAVGAALIADDVVRVEPIGDRIILSAPEAGSGLIEARGIGILRTPAAGPTALTLVLDLGVASDARLPDCGEWTRGGIAVPLIKRPKIVQPAAIRAAVLSGGPLDPTSLATASSLAWETSSDQGS